MNMQYKHVGSGNHSQLKDIFKNKSSPKFQVFLDVVSLVSLFGIMTIASIITSNLADNFLCLFFAVKLVLCIIPYAFTSNKSQS